MIKILKSLAIITAVVAIAGGGTYAALHDVKQVAGTSSSDPAMSYKMASVKVGTVWGFPMKFDNIVPGKEYTDDVHIQYTGTTAGDLYFGATWIGGGAVFTDVLKVAIEKIDGNGGNIGWATGWVDPAILYTSWTKLDSNINPGVVSKYRIHVKVNDNAGNTLQGLTAYNGVVIEAIQAGSTPQGSPKSNNGNTDTP